MIDTYLTDSVVWVKAGGKDRWGKPMPATEVTIPARIERTSRRVRNFAGEEVTADARVFMADGPAHDDKIRFDGRDHPILRIVAKRSFSTSHHEVYVS